VRLIGVAAQLSMGVIRYRILMLHDGTGRDTSRVDIVHTPYHSNGMSTAEAPVGSEPFIPGATEIGL